MIYLGACLIAGIRLARETSINHRQIPTSNAINESVDLAHEIYNRVFRKVPERLSFENARPRMGHFGKQVSGAPF
jgi:hypothetical protein